MTANESLLDGNFRHVYIRGDYDHSEFNNHADITHLHIEPEGGQPLVGGQLHLPSLISLSLVNYSQPLLEICTRETIIRVQQLLIACSGDPVNHLRGIGRLEQLQGLTYVDQEIDSLALTWISEQSQLERIAAFRTNATDSLIASLCCRETLKLLDFNHTRVEFSSEMLNDISFPLVRSLNVSDTEIRDDSIPMIEMCFPHIQRLLMRGTNVSREAIANSKILNQLIVLESDYAEFTFDYHNDQFWDL